jgi:MscS family membrane protein
VEEEHIAPRVGLRRRLFRRFSAVAVLVAVCLASPPAFSQIPGLPTTPAPVAPAPEAPAPPEAPPVYANITPRGATYNFLAEARRVDYAKAATHLDLSGIPAAQRAEQGPLLARHLKVVLDRTLWLDFEKISDDAAGNRDDGLAPNSELLGTIESWSGSVMVTLRRMRVEDGTSVWKFPPTLVEQIPALYDEFGYGWIGERVPDRLRTMRALGVESWQALGLLIVVALAVGVGMAGAFVFARVTEPIVRRTRNQADDRVLAMVRRPARFVFAVAFLASVVPALHLPVGAHVWVNRFLTGLAFVAAVVLISSVIDGLAMAARDRMEREGHATGVGTINFVNGIVKVLLGGIALIGILQALGFNVTSLIAGLGIGGIAVALAAQKTLENLLGGFMLMTDQPVRIGDFCRFGDKSGVVEAFGYRSTRLRTLDRSVISIPNSELANVAIENMAARDRIRFVTTLQLRYETAADQLRAVLEGLRALLSGHPRVDRELLLRVRFAGFGESSLNVEIQCWITSRDEDEFRAIREELLLSMMDVVAANGSGFAFPSRTVYMAKEGALALPTSAQSDQK